MTPEEAKQLKPGDRVLVEAEVTCAVTGYPRTHHISSRGNVGLKTPIISYPPMAYPPMAHWMVAPEAIRKKIETSRKFRKGDIVLVADGVHEVCEDETDGVVKVLYYCRGIVSHKAKELLLICPVEDRTDRKEVERG